MGAHLLFNFNSMGDPKKLSIRPVVRSGFLRWRSRYAKSGETFNIVRLPDHTIRVIVPMRHAITVKDWHGATGPQRRSIRLTRYCDMLEYAALHAKCMEHYALVHGRPLHIIPRTTT